MMKTPCLVSAALALLILFVPSASNALDISIGGALWYAGWKFDEKTEQEYGGGDQKFDPEFMYGPVLSIKFLQSWSISSVFLYGKYDTDFGGNGGPEYIKRYDSDTSLNYDLSRYLKIFLGFKYMSYKFPSGSHMSIGPGIGIGFTIPLTDYLFILGNISGIYLRGSHEEKSWESGQQEKRDIEEPGFNSNISLAYYLNELSLTISIGYRYQYFNSKYENIGQGNMEQDHTFYGPIFSIIYSFDI